MKLHLPDFVADQLSHEYCQGEGEVFPRWLCSMTDIYTRSMWRGRQASGWQWLPAWILPWNRNRLKPFKGKIRPKKQQYFMYDHK